MEMNNIDDYNEFENINNEQDAMKKVMKSMFAVNDITLYLDTHPQDINAISLHNKYVQEYMNAKKFYEDNFGPLSMYAQMNKWNWVYNKWPWEGGKR